jgi:hypothetical protein
MRVYSGWIEHEDSDGDSFDITRNKKNKTLTIGNPFDNFVEMDETDVKTLINYLQNWVDTGRFDAKD